jgi:hypothetical protein
MGEPKRMPRWLAVTLWSLFTSLWVAVGLLLIVSPEAVEELWGWIGEQPAALQMAIWVAFLPVMVGVGVWLSSWALWIRLLVLALCVAWTTVAFYPGGPRSREATRGSDLR